ncbi:hypothetical protein NF27_KH00030 [Candidatus Jidaibacter acanthamoeba]|uniref:Uncharacterized protein n=1 Tax=Candidatus Jidaibacter acanthamoebae TaxID=86105 RepID=A0A0C1MW17_9RICK|nr:hypothetical protein NF27_KH00030 [Candidatus Jidaibacter acanthamoeba]
MYKESIQKLGVSTRRLNFNGKFSKFALIIRNDNSIKIKGF